MAKCKLRRKNSLFFFSVVSRRFQVPDIQWRAFFTLGIRCLCLAQHSSEGFYFFLELKTEHVSSEQPPSFVKNAMADNSTAAEDWAESFWYSRAVHRGLCAMGTHHGGSKCPDSWETVPSPPFLVAWSLVMTASSLVVLEGTHRNSSVLFSFALFFMRHHILGTRSYNLFVTLLKLFEMEEIIWVISKHRAYLFLNKSTGILWLEEPHNFLVMCWFLEVVLRYAILKGPRKNGEERKELWVHLSVVCLT